MGVHQIRISMGWMTIPRQYQGVVFLTMAHIRVYHGLSEHGAYP